METLNTEQWKPIPGYEGLYDASTFGRIRSTPGKTTSSARFKIRHWKTRILKEKYPKSSKRQDRRVSLWKNGIHRDYLVSRLVASAFHGEPSDGMTVNHINGDWTDNRPSNLEWVTLSDNIRHGIQTGLYSSIRKQVVLSASSEDLCFSSMADVDRFLGRVVGYTSCRYSKGYQMLYAVGGTKYSYKVVG